MGKPTINSSAVKDASGPIIINPHPKREFVIEVLLLVIGVFTAIKVAQIDKRLADIEAASNAGFGKNIISSKRGERELNM